MATFGRDIYEQSETGADTEVPEHMRNGRNTRGEGRKRRVDGKSESPQSGSTGSDSVTDSLSYVSGIKDNIKGSLENIDWSAKITSEFVLKKLGAAVLGAVVMLVAHLLGATFSAWIDRSMKGTVEARLTQEKEKKDQQEEEEEKDRKEETSKNGSSSTKTKGKENGNGNGNGSAEHDDVHRDEMAFRSRNALASLGSNFVYIFFLALGFVIVLRVIGVEIATVIAFLSTTAILIGLALQGTLSDIAAGVLLAMFQVYEAGDIIRLHDRDGRVVDFRMINTLLQDMHSMTLVTVPNRVIQDSIVVNYSRSRYHMFSFLVKTSNVDENENFGRIVRRLKKDLRDEAKYPEIFRHPRLESEVGVYDMGEPATVLRVSVPMTPTPDLDRKRNAVRTKTKDTLRKLKVKMWPTR